MNAPSHKTVDYGAAPLNLNLTVELAGFLARTRFEDLAGPVVHEARRGVLDWLGCALAGSPYPTIDKLVSVLDTVSGKPVATVLGRDLKLGLLEAPLANGQMGHLLDYDDTHMDGVVLHTSSPVLSALLALGDARGGISGADLITAYVCGFEAGVRVGKSAPAHHDGGWHLTGTLGTVAAGLASARLIGLSPDQTTYAAGVATTQASGMQQNRGTMCKSFHAGRAGSNGVLAALLAEAGYDSSLEIWEGKRGFNRIYSTTADPEALTRGLGDRWEIQSNGHKPYACGVVLHPLIDAMIEARANHDIPAEQIASVDARIHPHVIKITGVENPESGLKSKFSLTHSAAVAFIDQTAGKKQYSDERALAPEVAALRNKVTPIPMDDYRKDQAHVTIKTTDGQTIEIDVPHASGTAANPMTDAAMERKFTENAAPVIGAERAAKLVDMIWGLDKVADIRDLTTTAA